MPSLTVTRLWQILAIVMCCCAAGGCRWNLWARNPYTGAEAPAILPQAAPLDQLLTAVNTNTGKVQSIFSTNAGLTAEGSPISLRGNLAVERPRNFRLRADSILGPELDVGSNGEGFWLWVKRNQPPALFVGRHDQFAASQAKQIFPIEPEWLIEALGLVTFSPQQQIQGPMPRGPDQVEIRHTRMSGGQPLQQITRLDAKRAVVLEQHLYLANGERVASALTSEHRLEMQSGAVLPRKIVLEWPASKMKLTIDLWDLQVNRITTAQSALWERPSYPDTPIVDLAQPGVQFGPAPNGGNMLLGSPTATGTPPNGGFIPTTPGTTLSPGPAALPPNNFSPPVNSGLVNPASYQAPVTYGQSNPATLPVATAQPTGVYIPNAGFDIAPQAPAP